MCFTRIYGFIFYDPKVINSSLDLINRSFAVPENRRLSANIYGIFYQEYDPNISDYVERWYMKPVYKEFSLSRTGISITFEISGIYLVIEGTQRNGAGFTSSIDVFIISAVNNSITYNKIYSGQSDTYVISTNTNTLSFTNYNVTRNLGIIAYALYVEWVPQ